MENVSLRKRIDFIYLCNKIHKRNPIMAKKVINLKGPEGNAFVLMGYGRSLCRQMSIYNSKMGKKMIEAINDKHTWSKNE